MKGFIEESPLNKSLISVLSSLAIYFIIVGQPVWGSNDEVYMSGLAAGIWEGLSGPSADLFYLHKGCSLVLQQLYLWHVDFPWYTLLFILLLAGALLVINYSILRLQRGGDLFFLIVMATLSTSLPALWHLQHTVLAGLVSMAGGILFLSLFIRRPASYRSLFTGISLVLALLVIGSMIRFTSFLMIAALFTAFGLVFFLRMLDLNRKSRQYSKDLKLQLLLVGFICGLIPGTQWLNKAAYDSDQQWLDWFALNKAKSEFTDFERIVYNDQTKHLFDSVGWSETDYQMIKTWQYADPRHYALEKFEKLLRSYPKQTVVTSIGEMGLQAWKSKIIVMARTTLSVWGSIMLLPVILLITLYQLNWSKTNLIYLGAIFTASFLILIYLFIALNRAPFRVLILLWLGVLWLLILLATNPNFTDASKSRGIKTEKSMSLLLIGLMAIISFLDLNHADKIQRKAVDKQRAHIQMLATWSRNLPKSSIIYNIGSSFQFESHLPLMSFEYMRTLNGFITMGWTNQSPLQRAHFTSLGLDVDFYGSLAQKKNLYIVEREYLGWSDNEQDILRSFYKEKYDLDLQFIAVPELPRLSRMVFNKQISTEQ